MFDGTGVCLLMCPVGDFHFTASLLCSRVRRRLRIAEGKDLSLSQLNALLDAVVKDGMSLSFQGAATTQQADHSSVATSARYT